MSAARFFVSHPCAKGVEVELDPSDARHARTVLRMKAGDAVIALRDGVAWNATLTAVSSDAVRARCEDVAQGERGELAVAITVLQALTKGARFEFVVEKAVELGARRIVPVQSERSVARAEGGKLERWRRIARAAAEQSRRLIVPEVTPVSDWAPAIEGAVKTGALIVATETAPPGSLASAIAGLGAASIALAVGPEGSFTDRELDVARIAGAHFVSLGPTILRTESASIALLSAIASRFW